MNITSTHGMIYNSLEEAKAKIEEYKHKLNKLRKLEKELEEFGFDFDCRNIRAWYNEGGEEQELLIEHDFRQTQI